MEEIFKYALLSWRIAMNGYFILGLLFWGIVVLFFYILRKSSQLHAVTMEVIDNKKKKKILAVMVTVILGCILPMGGCPIWNGEIPEHRNQYEVLAESILQGHFYVDNNDIDPRLLEMENPYDTALRTELGVNFKWDHAYYNGHYYVYFGVVPVFLLFLPYRIITGTALTTYHATQIFVIMFIIGIFLLFYLLTERFFNKITFGMYLMMSSCFSVISIWYSIEAPALYCTAITSGLCLEVWSLYFFVKAVWGEENENSRKSICYAFFGSLMGALAFGCRPPVALANILVLPLLVEYLRKRKINIALVKQLLFAASPYVIVAVLLMAYNYSRFDSFFEFGQAYQLTVADQSSYGNIIGQFSLIKILNGILSNFISYSPISSEFPYISLNGAFINFPLLFFPIIALSHETVRNMLKREHLWNFIKVLLFMPVLVTAVDVLWVPALSERYRMDIYWLMGILCFMIIGCYYKSLPENLRKKFSYYISNFAFISIFICFLLFIVPNDLNVTDCSPELLEIIKKVFTFGFSQASS